MAANPQLPRPQSVLIAPNNWPTTEWYEFWRNLLIFVQENGGTLEQIAEIEARLAALEAAPGTSVVGLNSLNIVGDPVSGYFVQLDNDVNAPGNTYYYGTGPTGVKGFFTVASAFTATQDGIALVTGGNGVTDIRPDDDLAAVEALTGAGLAARTGTNTWALRTLTNGDGIDLVNPAGTAGNPQISFNADTGEVAHLPGSTYSTVQKFIDTMHSPGVINGPTFGIVTSGIPATPIRVLAGKGMIRIADDDVSQLPFFDWAQTDFAQPNDGLTRFYGVVYNGGSPVVQQRTTYNWDKDTEIPLGSAVIFASGVTVITPNSYKTGDPITNIIQRFDAQSPAIRDASIGGLLLGETGTRNNTLTAGKIWSRLSDFDSAAKNSSTTPMLSAYFNGTGLTVTSGITQWDNLNFNNLGTGSLQVMGNNKYANLWYFISIDGSQWGFAYGTNEYNSIGAAANEGIPPYLNQNFFNQALLLGRLIFQKSAATASLIESAFTSIFNTAAINNHNDLAGLQGGAVGEYYHLTNSEHTDLAALAALGTGFPTHTGADTWAARSFPNGTGFTWTNPAGIAGDPTLVLNANLQAWSAITTASKEPAITAGTTAQLWRGDKTFTNTLTGSFGVGGTFAIAGLLGAVGTLWAQTDSGTARFLNYQVGAGVTGAQFIGIRSQGTLAAPTFPSSAQNLFELYGSSYNGTTQHFPSNIAIVCEENHTTTAAGTGFYIQTTPVGSTASAVRIRINAAGNWMPGSDNFSNIGSGALRMKEIFAAIGAINTSDADEKDEVVTFTSSELSASADIAREIGTYRWLKSIEEKGENARRHIGLTVQRAIDIMQSHGLDPFRYGFICYDEWDDVPAVVEEWGDMFNDEGTLIREAGSRVIQDAIPAGHRYGFRHDQLLLFIARGQAERLERLEALLNL